MKNRSVRFILLFFLAGVLALAAAKNPVLPAPQTLGALDARWDWAIKKAQSQPAQEGFYIGYTIQRLMAENSHIGSWSPDSQDEDETTLYEIITGKKLDKVKKEQSVLEAARQALKQQKRESKSEKKILKDVALLFRFSSKAEGKFDCEAIKVSELNLAVELEKGAIYWLGKAEKGESVRFLGNFFKAARTSDLKKKLLMAVSLHDREPQVLPFLKEVLYGNLANDIREDAAFWLGIHGTYQSANILLDVAQHDHSESVREKAVFGLYLINLPEASDALIKLARKGDDPDVRKKAIFWLSQKAIKRSAEVLGSMAMADPDTEVQTQAVFALSQISRGGGIPQLIKIARSHGNIQVRKKAIFWLGQSNDPRALETIIDIVKLDRK